MGHHTTVKTPLWTAQPFYLVVTFIAKTLLVALVLLWFSARNSTSPILGSYLGLFSGAFLIRALAALLVSLTGFLIDEMYLYPYFYSPLRHLPTVYSGYDSILINEEPRGKTPLQWAIAHPEVDLLQSRGFFGQSLLLPYGHRALRDILSTNTYDFEKPWGLRAYLARIFGFGLIASEGQMHKRQRNAMKSSFKLSSIRALYPTMFRLTGTLLDRLQAEMDKAGKLDITPWASRFALDVIGRGALSKNFEALTTPELHPIAKAFYAVLEPNPALVLYLGIFLAFPTWIVERLPMAANWSMEVNCRYIREQGQAILEDKQKEIRRGKNENENNLLSKIIASGEFEDEELVDQMLTFIGAGHETSASSIAWATHLLTLPENLHYQDKLREEIRKAIPATALPNDTMKCDLGNDNHDEAALTAVFEHSPYLNGICEEVLRLFPAVPATMREAVRRTTISGTIIPKGTVIIIMNWAINRNPRYWGADADKMRPERWIDTLENGTTRINKHGGAESNFCETTFLHGQRACIGKDFAKAELKAALAGLFGRFKVRRLAGDDGTSVRIVGGVTTKPMGGLQVQMTAVPGW